jgi:hypothetical protein
VNEATRATVERVRSGLEVVLLSVEREDERHTELRLALDAVPPRRRGRAWRETSVLIDLAFRQRPRRTLKQLRRMRNRRGEDFAVFWEECRRVLAPYTLGAHGYKVALGAHDETAVWREAVAVMSAIRELGHATFVNSGTLLGLVRDGTVIRDDDDVDLAVLLKSSSGPDAAEEWNALRTRLGEVGLLKPGFDNFGKHHCKVFVHGGVAVDLFPAWIADDRVFVWPHTHGELPATTLLPLEEREVAGVSVALPRVPEPMLELNYGPGWRTPDPTFHFDWAGAKARFAEFLTHLRTPDADEETRHRSGAGAADGPGGGAAHSR